MAKLITQGKEQGMQSFMVQLRDIDTHQPLPGESVNESVSQSVGQSVSLLVSPSVT